MILAINNWCPHRQVGPSSFTLSLVMSAKGTKPAAAVATSKKNAKAAIISPSVVKVARALTTMQKVIKKPAKSAKPVKKPDAVPQAKVTKPPRRFKASTILARDVKRLRFGSERMLPLLKRSTASQLVRGHLGASTRVQSAVMDDLRNAAEAFILREFEQVAPIVRFSKSVTVSEKHFQLLDEILDAAY